VEVPKARLQQLLADLDAAAFAQREAASRQLADLEEQAEPALQAALAANPSAEQRRRLEELLAAPRVVRSPEKLRVLRAIQVLEQIGTAEARRVLEALARGAADARPTQDARSVLQRLGAAG